MPKKDKKKSFLPPTAGPRLRAVAVPPEKHTEKYWEPLNGVIDPELGIGRDKLFMPKKDIKKIIPVPIEKRTEKYWELLNGVIDPELGIGIVDLGLIYNIEIADGHATITMTLTSMGCPVGPSIIHQVEDVAEKIADVEEVSVNLVWEPAWTADRMNPDVRAMLAI